MDEADALRQREYLRQRKFAERQQRRHFLLQEILVMEPDCALLIKAHPSDEPFLMYQAALVLVSLQPQSENRIIFLND